MTGWRPDGPAQATRRVSGRVALLLLLALALWRPLEAQQPAANPAAESGPDSGQVSDPGSHLVPYHARYAIYRNGKLTGKIDVTLEKRGERWTLRSEGSGTHGLARILAARDNEETTGFLVDGRFRPDRYFRHTRVAGIDDRWTVHFDWDQRQVSVVHDNDDPLMLEMSDDDAVDPLSLKLDMRRRLSEAGVGSDPDANADPGTDLETDLEADPETDPDVDPETDAGLHFEMVEEDEIDPQNFRLLPAEWMETSLGCLRTTVVEKIRHNSKRYTRAWHAPELDYMEVRMEHGKTGGNHLEMRINELTVDGVEVTPRPGCAARQATGEVE